MPIIPGNPVSSKSSWDILAPSSIDGNVTYWDASCAIILEVLFTVLVTTDWFTRIKYCGASKPWCGYYFIFGNSNLAEHCTWQRYRRGNEVSIIALSRAAQFWAFNMGQIRKLSFVLGGTHFSIVYKSVCLIIHVRSAKIARASRCQHCEQTDGAGMKSVTRPYWFSFNLADLSSTDAIDTVKCVKCGKPR